MNKKILIAICVVAIVAIGIIAFVVLKSQPREELYIQWGFSDESKVISIVVVNDGNRDINVTRVELIYLPNETLGLIWIESRIIKYKGHRGSTFSCALREGEQLDFFNLLVEVRTQNLKDSVNIIVETTKAIYTFEGWYTNGVMQLISKEKK